jgi:hypothetical protein
MSLNIIGMDRWPVKVLEQFWYSYPLNDPSDLGLFRGQPRDLWPPKKREMIIFGN